MNVTKPQPAIGIKYVCMTAVAVLFSWLLHEFAHWAVGEFLGNDMAMTLNTSYPKAGNYLQKSHAAIVSAAGPLVTLIQAFSFFYLLKRKDNDFLFPFLLTCLYMRSLAGFLNLINLNDEGRISKDLGLGVYTLPLIVIAVLFYLVYHGAKAKGYKTKFIMGSVLLIMLFSSVIVLTDQWLHVKIL